MALTGRQTLTVEHVLPQWVVDHCVTGVERLAYAPGPVPHPGGWLATPLRVIIIVHGLHQTLHRARYLDPLTAPLGPGAVFNTY